MTTLARDTCSMVRVRSSSAHLPVSSNTDTSAVSCSWYSCVLPPCKQAANNALISTSIKASLTNVSTPGRLIPLMACSLTCWVYSSSSTHQYRNVQMTRTYPASVLVLPFLWGVWHVFTWSKNACTCRLFTCSSDTFCSVHHAANSVNLC